MVVWCLDQGLTKATAGKTASKESLGPELHRGIGVIKHQGSISSSTGVLLQA